MKCPVCGWPVDYQDLVWRSFGPVTEQGDGSWIVGGVPEARTETDHGDQLFCARCGWERDVTHEEKARIQWG